MFRRALVRLVDDHRVVAAQLLVAPDLRQQQAVGHQPHARVAARAVAEADRVADRLAERHLQLLGDAGGDGARGQPPRLRVGDPLAAELEAQLGQLRRLAGARLAGDDDHLVVADRLQQLLPVRADRELGRVARASPSLPRRPARPRARRSARSRRASAATRRGGGRAPCPRSSAAARPGSRARWRGRPTAARACPSSPWMTSVGAVIVRSSGLRSPDAMIAASWRSGPAGLIPRS